MGVLLNFQQNGFAKFAWLKVMPPGKCREISREKPATKLSRFPDCQNKSP